MDGDRAKNWARLTSELPALAARLEELRIPKALKCPRFGVQAYHNPEILEVISDISPERRLANLVDEVIFKDKKADEWEGSAEELEKVLRSSPFTFAVERLLYFSSACGVYLNRLSQKQPARFQHRKNNGRTFWRVVR